MLSNRKFFVYSPAFITLRLITSTITYPLFHHYLHQLVCHYIIIPTYLSYSTKTYLTNCANK
nr:MAG TPA: hypothetical protein [Caudoviricetes sp.]